MNVKTILITFIYILISLIIFFYYVLLFKPYIENKDNLMFDSVDIKQENKNLEKLNEDILLSDNDVLIITQKLDDLKKGKTFEDIPYLDFIDYIGLTSEMYDLDIRELNDYSDPSFTDYLIGVQGSYVNTMKFVNSLYLLTSYFHIKEFKLETKQMIPLLDVKSDRERIGNSEITYEWFKPYLETVDDLMPSDLKEDNLISVIEKELEEDYIFEKPLEDGDVFLLTFKIRFLNSDQNKR